DQAQPVGGVVALMKGEEVGADRMPPALGHSLGRGVRDHVHRDRDDRERLTEEAVALVVASLRPAEGAGRTILALTGALGDPLHLEAAALDQALRGLKDDLVVRIADATRRGATKDRAAEHEQ